MGGSEQEPPTSGSDVTPGPGGSADPGRRPSDPVALEELYRELSPRVAGYLRAHGVADVGGTTNDVFLRVFANVGSFDGDEAALRSWVFTIAHHLMVDEQRRHARRPVVAGDLNLDARPSGADAEAAALASLGRERVDELLALLSPDQRSVLLLRVVADLSIDEVSRILGKRVTAVKALQHRGLAALRRHLERGEVSP